MLIVLGPLPVASRVGKRKGEVITRHFCPLSPNARMDWRAKRPYTVAARTEARLTALDQINRIRDWKPFERVVVWPTIYVPAKRNFFDDDNALACLKPYFDGLADAGIVQNDRHMKRMTPEFRVDAARPRIELRIEAVSSSSSA